MLTHQITLIRKKVIIQDGIYLFEKHKTEYFYYLDQIRYAKIDPLYAIKNLIELETKSSESGICTELADFLGNEISDCETIADGINTN